MTTELSKRIEKTVANTSRMYTQKILEKFERNLAKMLSKIEYKYVMKQIQKNYGELIADVCKNKENTALKFDPDCDHCEYSGLCGMYLSMLGEKPTILRDVYGEKITPSSENWCTKFEFFRDVPKAVQEREKIMIMITTANYTKEDLETLRDVFKTVQISLTGLSNCQGQECKYKSICDVYKNSPNLCSNTYLCTDINSTILFLEDRINEVHKKNK